MKDGTLTYINKEDSSRNETGPELDFITHSAMKSFEKKEMDILHYQPSNFTSEPIQ